MNSFVYDDCQIHQELKAIYTCITCGKMICSNCTQHRASQHQVTQLPQLNVFLEAISKLPIEIVSDYIILWINFEELEINVKISYELVVGILKKLKKIIQEFYRKIKEQLPKYKCYINEVTQIKQYVQHYKQWNLTQQLSSLSKDIAQHLFLNSSYIKLKSQEEVVLKIPSAVSLFQSIQCQFSMFMKQIQNEKDVTDVVIAPTYYLDAQAEKLEMDQPRIVDLFNQEANHYSSQSCFFRAKKKTTLQVGRIEKLLTIGGAKCWYMDLIYPKPQSKILEPQQCCVLCKTHPEFVSLRLFIQKIRYGEVCGPIIVSEQQRIKLQDVFSRRNDQQDIGNNREIYLHEICAYWSSGVICDEVQGEVNIDSLIRCTINSIRQICHLCKWTGATMRCNHPNCPIYVHYGCFKQLHENNQKLDPYDKFRMRCPQHSQRPYTKPSWCSREDSRAVRLEDVSCKKKPKKENMIVKYEMCEDEITKNENL